MKILCRFLIVIVCCITIQTFAASLGSMSQGILNPLDLFKKALSGIAVVMGVFFLFSAWIRYMRYRRNPQEVPISTVIVYVIIGIAFLVLTLSYRLTHYENVHHGMQDVAASTTV